MGFLANAVHNLMPERKSAVGALVPTWDSGTPMTQPVSYDRNAREGYMLDELVYQCVDMRASSAGEPPLAAYKKTSSGEELIDDHPALDLLNDPNPFMGRARFWASISMYLDISGNAYVEKVRSGAGKLVELWPLRPDRVTVIPDSRTFIGGYQYRIGDITRTLPAEDVIHFRTRHPLNDYYGLSPLYVLAGTVDLDVWARRFSEAFFRNAGVPAGLLNIQRAVNESERESMRQRFRELYGGIEGWHRLMVIDGGNATYEPMGLPLGQSGLAMYEMRQWLEARIMGVFGIPLGLIPTLIGAMANRGQTASESERQLFWELTMVPLFRDLDSMLSTSLVDEFPDVDRLGHDLTKVKAMQEDVDKLHTRWRENWRAGLCTWSEARTEIGMSPEPDEAGIVILPTTMVPTWSDELLTEPEPPPEPAPPAMLPPGQQAPNGQQPPANGQSAPAPAAPAANGRTNGAAH